MRSSSLMFSCIYWIGVKISIKFPSIFISHCAAKFVDFFLHLLKWCKNFHQISIDFHQSSSLMFSCIYWSDVKFSSNFHRFSSVIVRSSSLMFFFIYCSDVKISIKFPSIFISQVCWCFPAFIEAMYNFHQISFNFHQSISLMFSCIYRSDVKISIKFPSIFISPPVILMVKNWRQNFQQITIIFLQSFSCSKLVKEFPTNCHGFPVGLYYHKICHGKFQKFHMYF